MPTCSYCSSPISQMLEVEGGYCPTCNNRLLPLADFDDDFATEVVHVPSTGASSTSSDSSSDSAEDVSVDEISIDDIAEIAEIDSFGDEDEFFNDTIDFLDAKKLEEDIEKTNLFLRTQKEKPSVTTIDFLDEDTEDNVETEEVTAPIEEEPVEANKQNIPVVPATKLISPVAEFQQDAKEKRTVSVKMAIPEDEIQQKKGVILDEDVDYSSVPGVTEDGEELLDYSAVFARKNQVTSQPSPSSTPKKQTPQTRWMVLGFVFVVMFLVIALFFGRSSEPPTESPSTDKPKFSAPTVEIGEVPPEVVEEEKKETKTTKKTQTTKKEEKSFEIVEQGGVTSWKTAGPVRPSSTLDDTLAKSTDQRRNADVDRLKSGLEYCYQKALKSNPTVSGKWKVTFTIDKSGKATNTKISALRKANTDIESCMKTKVNNTNFTKADYTTPVDFSVLFGG